MERYLFLAFCTLFVWSPLPIGSNSDLACDLLLLWTSFLFILWLTLTLQNKVGLSKSLHQHSYIALLFWLIPIWTLCQLIPLPLSFHNSLLVFSTHTSAFPWSTDIGASLYTLEKNITYALTFTLALALINTPERLKTICNVIIFTAVFEATYGSMVALGGKSVDFLHIRDISTYTTAIGTFINRNHLAGYLEMTIAIGIGLLITHILENKDPYRGWRAALRRFLITLMSGKARLRIFLALMVIALVLTRSRTGNAAFFTSLGICGATGLALQWKMGGYKSSQAKAMFVLFSSLIFIDVLILSSWFGLEKLAQRLEGTTLEREERSYVFPQAIEMLKDVWPTGTGAGSFYSNFHVYKTNQIYFYYDFTHNDYLQIAIEYGVVGFMLFALIVIFSFGYAIKSQISRQTAIFRGVGFASMMGILSLMIHSFTDFNLQIPANALLFTLLCALACISYSMEHQPHEHTRKKRRRSSQHAQTSVNEPTASKQPELRG